MLRIRTHNQIALRGLERFPRDRFEIASDLSDPDAILLRSHPLGADALPATVRAVARAGAGVNNIDVAHCSERGIPVFNTPGANANAVKELVLAGLLLSARHLRAGLDWVDALEAADEADLHRQVEAGKKQFQGRELSGRTLGVIGLGAIGSRVARIALHLGMRVIGYDPALSVDAAWRLPSQVSPMVSLEALLARADFVTLHLPLLDATRDLIGAQQLAVMKPDAVLLNFARQGIVDDGAVAAALEAEALGAFVTDFPSLALAGARGVLTLPHLWASTGESEENCAMMAGSLGQTSIRSIHLMSQTHTPAAATATAPQPQMRLRIRAGVHGRAELAVSGVAARAARRAAARFEVRPAAEVCPSSTLRMAPETSSMATQRMNMTIAMPRPSE